jgi:hypothetical protein
MQRVCRGVTTHARRLFAARACAIACSTDIIVEKSFTICFAVHCASVWSNAWCGLLVRGLASPNRKHYRSHRNVLSPFRLCQKEGTARRGGRKNETNSYVYLKKKGRLWPGIASHSNGELKPAPPILSRQCWGIISSLARVITRHINHSRDSHAHQNKVWFFQTLFHGILQC